MKTFVALALTLVLTASCLVGCGCTNQKMDNTSAPTVLPTNEEIWNSTEATTRSTTEATGMTDPSVTANPGETTDSTENTTIENKVNASSELTDKLMEMEKASKSTEESAGSSAQRMIPGSR